MHEVEERSCFRCKGTFPTSEFHHYPRRERWDSYCKPCRRSYRREQYARDRDNILRINNESRLRTTYGIEPEEYRRLLAEQDGRCAICKTTEGNQRNQRLTVDHDHDTGQVRGLLCQPCNSAIGYLQDNPVLVLKAHQYLTRRAN